MVPELGIDGEVLLTIEAIFGIWGNEVTVADARASARTLEVHWSLEA